MVTADSTKTCEQMLHCIQDLLKAFERAKPDLINEVKQIADWFGSTMSKIRTMIITNEGRVGLIRTLY